MWIQKREWKSANLKQKCRNKMSAGCLHRVLAFSSIDKFDSWINLLRLRNLGNATSFSFVGNTRSNDSSRYLTIQEFMGFLGDPSNSISISLEKTYTSSERTFGWRDDAATEYWNKALLNIAERQELIKKVGKSSSFNHKRSSIAEYVDDNDRKCAQFLSLIDGDRTLVRILVCISGDPTQAYKNLRDYLSRDIRLSTRAENVSAYQITARAAAPASSIARIMSASEERRSICARAISQSEQPLAWTTDENFYPIVEEARRRSFTLERCAKMLGRM